MTHPLTDEDCYKLCNAFGSDHVFDNMRRSADWQLEEVKRKVELTLEKWRISGYSAGADASEDFFEEVMQELRPQQQEYK